ncbi:MAG: helix-hairpin-helix domain-containing protein [Nitrospirota bacterium]|nr:helix-hairpin-helix domain-containing protein [Nitrospirota bacterium]MDH5297352.1 helix-hairpin-helix domain-containing protein [Nitrospirota bacterium]MDH5575782.1 helix-hairpin-helix domain-containing protein [Nitrospirota bacterium]
MITNPKQVSVFVLALVLSVGLLFPMAWAEAAGSKIDINAASLEQLESVKGVGPDIAQNILTYKKDHGAFKTLDDLSNVKGVGKVRLEALRDAFTVGSTPSATGETSPKK